MPVTVRKRKGKKPWKIVNKRTGRVEGSSTSKRKASIAAGMKNRAHRR